MKDFLIRSTEDLYVVRGTDRYGGPFEWATHDLPTAAKWAAGVVRRKGEASIERHVYHGGRATFVFAETINWFEVTQ